MTAYDFTDKSKGYYVGSQIPTLEDNLVVAQRAVIDFSTQNLSASDTATVMDVPAASTILGGFIRCITADASVQLSYGYGTSVNEFASGAAFAAAGTVLGGWLSTPDYVASATAIKVKATAGSPDTLKLEAIVYLIKPLDDQ